MKQKKKNGIHTASGLSSEQVQPDTRKANALREFRQIPPNCLGCGVVMTFLNKAVNLAKLQRQALDQEGI